MTTTVKYVRILRSTVVIGLCGEDRIILNNKDGLAQVEPSFYQCTDGEGEAWFNLASCMDGKCITAGQWQLCGASAEDIDSIFADFSKGSCTFKVDITCKDGGLLINIDYTPTKLGLSDKLVSVGLRMPHLLGKLLRGRAKRVLFTSESRASLSGNMEYVINAVHGDFGANRIIYSFKPKGSRLAFYLKTSFLAGLCSTVVVDDYYPLIYRLKFGHDRVIQLWHACGAFKAVGYSRLGKPGAPQPDEWSHRNYTHVTVSSQAVAPYYAEAFGIPLDRVYATGVPRTDMFFDPDAAAKKRDEFFAALPHFKDREIILFAPTFRGDGVNTAHYPAQMIDFDGLADFCRQNNAAIVFKMHPFVRGFTLPDGYGDVFADAGDMREINDILFAADALITDYSSVIYEYSLLERPIIFYTYDLEEYCKSRDFYMPIEQYAGEHRVNSSQQLVTLLNSGEYKSWTAHNVRQHSMSACDGQSSKRVADLIFHELQ